MSPDAKTAGLEFFFVRDLGTERLKQIFGEDYDPSSTSKSPAAASEDGLRVHEEYATELPFHDVKDVDGTSEIPSICGIDKPERDPAYGFLAQTHRNFIRIYLMQLTRIEMSKKPRSPLKDLSRACECLPIEVFFEIFSHLQPIDLYNLCQAGQPFHGFLVGSEASESTWRNAFTESDHSIPLPLPNVPGFRRAHLLFGPSICTAPPPGDSSCERRGAVIDFANRHRVCRKCWVKYYFNKYRHPVYDHDDPVWELLPTTKRRSWVRPDSFHVPFLTVTGGGECRAWYSDLRYYIPSVEQMAEDLSVRKAELSEDMYLQHIESQKADVSAREKLITAGQQWSDNIIRDGGQILYRKMWSGWKPILDRKVMELGFNSSEADTASWVLIKMQYAREVTIYKLTPKLWRKYRPQLIKRAQDIRDESLRNEIILSRDRQLVLVRKLLGEFTATQPPSSLEYLPTAQHLMTTEPFYSSAIDAIIKRHNPDPPVERNEDYPDPLPGFIDRVVDRYDQYLDDLPAFIDRWQQDTRSSFIDQIPRPSDASLSSKTEPTTTDSDSPHDMLSFARSVFECLDCPSTKGTLQPHQPGRALIGWKALNGHLSCPSRNWKNNIVYSMKGAEAARSLLTLAGLDPESALTDDLDALDYRFTCASCPIGPTGKRGYRGHKVWTWRECVYHFIQMSRVGDTNHQTPKWNRLSPEMSAYIKKREGPAGIEDLSWNCLHCGLNYADTTKTTTIEHIISSHKIEKPKVDIDFKYTMRGPCLPRAAVGLSEHPTPAQYYCLLCEKPKSQLYAYRSIGPHLLNKHAIKTGEEGRAYGCMPLYDAHYP